MPGFDIRRSQEGFDTVTVDVSGLSPKIVRSVGFAIDLETPLPGANPAQPNGNVIKRELAPGADPEFLVRQFGQLGLHPTEVQP